MFAAIISLCKAFESKVSGETAGVIYQILWTTTYFGSSVMHKLLKDVITIPQMVVTRGLFIFGVMHYLALTFKLPHYPSDRKEEMYRFIRSVAGNASFAMGSLLINFVPISEISVLTMVGPNTLGICDYLFNGAPISVKEIASAGVSFLGVFFILNPDMVNSLFGITTAVTPGYTDSQYVTGTLKVVLLGIYFIWMLFWAYSIVILKRVKSINVVTLNLLSGPTLVFSSGLLSIAQGYVSPINNYFAYVGIMVMGGVFAITSIFTVTRSNQIGKPALNGIVMNLHVVFSFLFEVFYLGEPIKLPSIIGAVMIILVTVYVNLSKLRSTKK